MTSFTLFKQASLRIPYQLGANTVSDFKCLECQLLGCWLGSYLRVFEGLHQSLRNHIPKIPEEYLTCDYASVVNLNLL